MPPIIAIHTLTIISNAKEVPLTKAIAKQLPKWDSLAYNRDNVRTLCQPLGTVDLGGEAGVQVLINTDKGLTTMSSGAFLNMNGVGTFGVSYSSLQRFILLS